jgi:hypothetical protein
MRKTLVRDRVKVKKLSLGDTFPGQTHFPEVSTPVRVHTIGALVVLAILASVFVWWLKS